MNKEFIEQIREYAFLIENRLRDGLLKTTRVRDDLVKMLTICASSEAGIHWIPGGVYHGASITHCTERLITWWRDRRVQEETIALIDADYMAAQKETAGIKQQRQCGEKINFAALVNSMKPTQEENRG